MMLYLLNEVFLVKTVLKCLAQVALIPFVATRLLRFKCTCLFVNVDSGNRGDQKTPWLLKEGKL